MSREIEFRAWVKMYDDSDGVMLNMPMNIHHFDFEDGIVISFTDYPEFYGHENYDHRKPKLPHEINIMQYTGLKDKNGIKIFEGDVVSVCYDGKDQDCWEAVVEWCKINPSFFLKKVNPPCSSLNEYDFIKCGLFELLVIGNIYENPELIKEVKNG